MMKVLVIANRERYEKFMPNLDIVRQCEVVYCPLGTSDEELLDTAADADVILADAIAEVSGSLIRQMSNLKLIHSEGVAFNKIDIQAAAESGVYVCNNNGANAHSVAEQTILLMLGVLRFVEEGHDAVLDGRQIQIKEERMVSGFADLGNCTVGLVGFGNIAKATAQLLYAFGCKCYYYSPHRKSAEMECQYHVTYLPLEKLLPACDIVSLHAAVTPETVHLMNADTLSMMKDGAYLVNTSRGELVDQEALCRALDWGHLKGAGLDTLSPEPVQTDNPLVCFAKEHPYRILFSPHIGGVSAGCFQNMHTRMWQNVQKIKSGERPDCVVNGL